MFYIFQYLLTQNPTNQGSLHSCRSYERLLENPKTQGSRKLFLAKNDFKTCYMVNFLKNIQILEAW